MTVALIDFDLADFPLQSGQRLRGAKLRYQAFGQLNGARDNAVIFPTWYSSKHPNNAWLIGEGKPLDPSKYFILVVNLFGNGVSTSPSTAAADQRGPQFPLITISDNIEAQRALMKAYSIEKLALYVGRSMGAMCAFHWAALYPKEIKASLMLTGGSRCSPHNFVFLASLKAALELDPAWAQGEYIAQPKAGIAAFGRIYAGWIHSGAWFRHGYCPQGPQAYLAQWERAFADRDANDLLAQLATWQNGDIAAFPQFGGDLALALGAITARAIVMPSVSDMYFPPEDSATEVGMMPNAELRVLSSVFGHRAGTSVAPAHEIAQVGQAIKDLLL